ncbi:MAG: DUF1080 domain-containing protein [Bacteroidales bacterium]|nr:DUF1080 domain-containing protein [Bacteroidales bacterium]
MRPLLSISLGLILAVSLLPTATADEPLHLFDGKTFTGWEGDTEKTWRIVDGAIVGGSLDTVVPRNEFLCTTRTFHSFELKVKFKLEGDPKTANAGIQFRTARIPRHHEVIGYQADMGQQYWGALYDESRRKRVLAEPDQEKIRQIVKLGEWNEYKIRCKGNHIQLWINGTQTVDYTEMDSAIPLAGVIGLQIHGGGKSRVSYRDITLAELAGGES